MAMSFSTSSSSALQRRSSELLEMINSLINSDQCVQLRSDVANYISETLLQLDLFSLKQQNERLETLRAHLRSRIGQICGMSVYSPALTQHRFTINQYVGLEELWLFQCPPSTVLGLYSLRKTLMRLTIEYSGICDLADELTPVKASVRSRLLPMIFSEQASPPLAKYSWSRLTSLKVTHCGLVRIDEAMHFFPNLVHLDLSHNSILHIAHLQDCIRLQQIDLSHNRIRVLSNLERVLGKVKSINLSHNEIQSLDGVDKVYSLEAIDLSSNYIGDIVEVHHLGRLPCLEMLILAKNPIADLPHYRLRIFGIFIQVGSIMTGNRAFPAVDKFPISAIELRRLRKLMFRSPVNNLTESTYDDHTTGMSFSSFDFNEDGYGNDDGPYQGEEDREGEEDGEGGKRERRLRSSRAHSPTPQGEDTDPDEVYSRKSSRDSSFQPRHLTSSDFPEAKTSRRSLSPKRTSSMHSYRTSRYSMSSSSRGGKRLSIESRLSRFSTALSDAIPRKGDYTGPFLRKTPMKIRPRTRVRTVVSILDGDERTAFPSLAEVQTIVDRSVDEYGMYFLVDPAAAMQAKKLGLDTPRVQDVDPAGNAVGRSFPRGRGPGSGDRTRGMPPFAPRLGGEGGGHIEGCASVAVSSMPTAPGQSSSLDRSRPASPSPSLSSSPPPLLSFPSLRETSTGPETILGHKPHGRTDVATLSAVSDEAIEVSVVGDGNVSTGLAGPQSEEIGKTGGSNGLSLACVDVSAMDGVSTASGDGLVAGVRVIPAKPLGEERGLEPSDLSAGNGGSVSPLLLSTAVSSSLPTYIGDPQYRDLIVADNLELYFREQVFSIQRPNFPKFYLRGPQGGAVSYTDDAFLSPFEQDERLVCVYLEKMIDISDPSAHGSAAASSGGENITPLGGGGKGLRRIATMRRSERGEDAPEDDDEVPEEVLTVVILTDVGLYLLNHASIATKQLVFADAPIFSVMRAHPLYTLGGVTIFFGFQRFALVFTESPGMHSSGRRSVYLIITRDKARTHPMVTRIPQVANAQRASHSLLKLSNVKIENKDGPLLEQVMRYVNSLGMMQDDIVHYQMVYQIFPLTREKDRAGGAADTSASSSSAVASGHGGAGTFRKLPRTVIITQTLLLLCKENLCSHSVELQVLDSYSLKEIQQIYAEENALFITVVFKRSSVLAKRKRWRFCTDARNPSSRLLEECKRACAEVGNDSV